MNLKEIYSLGQEIPEYLKDHNKYTWLAFNKLIEMHYIDINDILNKKTPINSFVMQHGAALLIPNIVNNKIVDMTVKALNSSATIKYKNVSLPYNIGNLKNFQYGDPLYVVEGVADVAGLKLIDPNINVIALQTNTIPNDMLPIYQALTNNIVLLLDNDKAGQVQYGKLKRKLGELGINTFFFKQFGSLKDTGEIVELVMSYKKMGVVNILNELNNVNLYYKSQIKLINLRS
jgi:5S rRNA maturation endonuclease (ribonuclease M5)